MFTASMDGQEADPGAANDWEPPPDEGDHFDWAGFERLLARDPQRSCPSLVPDPTGYPSGPFAAHLDSGTVIPDRLADAEVIDAVIGFEHLIAWAGARQARLLAEFAHRRPAQDPAAGPAERACATSRWAGDEIALALAQSRVTAAAKLAQATRLHQVLGATLAAWETGRLDARKVRAICEATLRLDEAQARAVQARVLPRAGAQSPAQLAAALQRAVLAVDPDGGDERHRKARGERRVVLTPVEDGMATLWACMTAPDAQTCYGWLTALARGLGQDDPRGMDARRLDLMVDLLTGRLTLTPTDGNTLPAPVPGGGPPSRTHPTGTESTGTSSGDNPTGKGSVGAVGAATDSTISAASEATDSDAEARTVDGAALDGAALDGAADPADPTTSDGSGDCESGDCKGGDCESGDCKGGDCESGDHEGGDHGVGGPGGACPTRPPPLLPWRPAPVTPGKPLVQIVIPLSTLTGADDQPVELIGYGPLPPAMARTLAADAVWKRLVTDPASGTLLDHGRTTYRPPAALSDFVRARDQTCRFPPCRRRALDIELDHTNAWTAQDGPTAEPNLYGACPHHHHLKHDAPGWTVTQTPDGLITWTTPTGHRYTSRPHDYRPEPAPPAPAAKITKEPAPVRPVLPDPWTLQPGFDDAPF